MADTGKQVRQAKTNLGGGGIGNQAPSERSQLVAQEVHQFRSASSGLEGLSSVLSGFFNQAQNALQSVQEGILVGERQKIEQQNAAQKQQALGDALAGKPMDTALQGDGDYYDAYRSVKAQRDGYAAYNDFHQWYLQSWLPDNPTGDLQSARQEWAKKNLTGSSDQAYEGQVLASFFQNSDQMIGQHQEFALKYQTAKGMENLGAAMDASVASGTMDAPTLNDFISKARVLDPLNATEAPSRVASALLASAQNHPEQMMAISNLLGQEGTGVNGKSFAQSWPQAYSDFQNKAVSAWNQINSVAALKTETDLEDRLRTAQSMDDLVSLTVDTYKFRQQNGGLNAASSILNAIQQKAAHFDQTETALKGVDQFMAGDNGRGDASAMDPSDVRKYWGDWMKARLGTANVMELDPKDATTMIHNLNGVVPDGLRTQLSAAIVDDRNPEAQARAIQIMSALTNTAGDKYAKEYLSSTAAQLYDNVAAIKAVTSEPMDTILKRVNDARSNIKNWDASWEQVTGEKDPNKARDLVAGKVNDTLREVLGKQGGFGPLFGTSAQIPLDLQKTVMDVARQKAIEAQSNGRGWEAGVKDAVTQIANNAEVLPGANGQLILSIRADQNTRYLDEKGHEAVRPRLGPQVVNPWTGIAVNTLDVYAQQRDELATKHPWVFPDGAGGVHLGNPDDRRFAPSGLLPVLSDNRNITYMAGQEITIPAQQKTPQQRGGLMAGSPEVFNNGTTTDTHTTIPADEAGMNKLFGNMPDGFKFVKQDTIHGVVWILGYRPNFGDKGGLSLDQKAATLGGGW